MDRGDLARLEAGAVPGTFEMRDEHRRTSLPPWTTPFTIPPVTQPSSRRTSLWNQPSPLGIISYSVFSMTLPAGSKTTCNEYSCVSQNLALARSCLDTLSKNKVVPSSLSLT